jgi:hypothetical protein
VVLPEIPLDPVNLDLHKYKSRKINLDLHKHESRKISSDETRLRQNSPAATQSKLASFVVAIESACGAVLVEADPVEVGIPPFRLQS